MNQNGRSRKSGSSSWLRTITLWAASWRYVAARRYTTFIGRARKSAPRKIGRGWYIMNPPRLSSASTTSSHRQIFRPARRSLTGRLEWKVKVSLLLRAAPDQCDAVSLFERGRRSSTKYIVTRRSPDYLSKFETLRRESGAGIGRGFICLESVLFFFKLE